MCSFHQRGWSDRIFKTDHTEILQKERRYCSLQNLFRRVHINLDQEVHVIGYKQGCIY